MACQVGLADIFVLLSTEVESHTVLSRLIKLMILLPLTSSPQILGLQVNATHLRLLDQVPKLSGIPDKVIIVIDWGA